MKTREENWQIPELRPREVVEVLTALHPDAVAKAHRSYQWHTQFSFPLKGPHLADHEVCVREVAEPLALSPWEINCLTGVPPLDCTCAFCAGRALPKDGDTDLSWSGSGKAGAAYWIQG